MFKGLKNVLLAGFFFTIIYILGYLVYAHYEINGLNFSAPVSTCTPENKPSTSQDVVKVLLVSGGGVLGIIPLVYLDYIEQQTHQKSAEIFDVFAGISTGGIVVGGLNIPDSSGRPRYSARQVLDSYMTISSQVMDNSFVRRFFTLDGLTGPIYDIRHLNYVLKKVFGAYTPLKKLIKPSIFAYFNLNTSKLEFFHSNVCQRGQDYSDYSFADLLTATCAAPTIFSSVSFENPKTHQKQYFVDAAIMSNNPFPYVFSKIIKEHPYAKKYIFVYLDTGDFHLKSLDLNSKNFNRWGRVQWVAPLIDILMKAHAKMIHQDVINLSLFLPKERFSYYYFNTSNKTDGFDASEKNLRDIYQAARASIHQQKSKFDELFKELESLN